MAVLDIGAPAINRGNSYNPCTLIDTYNPANDDGTIESFEIWAFLSLSSCKAGTFSGSGLDYDDRDYATLGSITSGSKQTFSGLSIDAITGDFVGTYFSAGAIERESTGGVACYSKLGDQFGLGSQTYSKKTSYIISLYAEGTITPPGWTGKIDGIDDPAKIDNTDVADIIKWDGIS